MEQEAEAHPVTSGLLAFSVVLSESVEHTKRMLPLLQDGHASGPVYAGDYSGVFSAYLETWTV